MTRAPDHMLNAAVGYARLGLPVFPLWPVIEYIRVSHAYAAREFGVSTQASIRWETWYQTGPNKPPRTKSSSSIGGQVAPTRTSPS